MQQVNCKIISSLYIHGQHSWIIRFIPASLKLAVHDCGLLRRRYADFIKDVLLLEIVFPVKIQGIANPDIDNLKEFII